MIAVNDILLKIRIMNKLNMCHFFSERRKNLIMENKKVTKGYEKLIMENKKVAERYEKFDNGK